VARILGADIAVATLGEHPAQQEQALGGAMGDHDVVRRHGHRPNAAEVTCKLCSQLRQTRGIRVAERLVGQRGERAAARGDPFRTRKR